MEHSQSRMRWGRLPERVVVVAGMLAKQRQLPACVALQLPDLTAGSGRSERTGPPNHHSLPIGHPFVVGGSRKSAGGVSVAADSCRAEAVFPDIVFREQAARQGNGNGTPQIARGHWVTRKNWVTRKMGGEALLGACKSGLGCVWDRALERPPEHPFAVPWERSEGPWW